MKGVGSIPPPFSEALLQGSAHRPLWKKINDGLKACLSDVGPTFKGKKVVPFHHLINASPTSIRG